MAVIDTSMDMPESCYKCPKRNVCSYAHCNGWIFGRRDDNCPLKSTDEMIAEIKYHRNKTAPIDKYDLVGDCLDIIHKYCDKEVEYVKSVSVR